MSEVMAGDATPWTTVQNPWFRISESWKAGHTLPRLLKLVRNMAIPALGAIHINVSNAIQRLTVIPLQRRVDGLMLMLSQMMSLGRGASVMVQPWGFFLRAA